MLVDRVVVVTGGAGLLGREFCAAIAAQNAIVVVADINAKAAETVATEICARGHRAEAMTLDITSKDSVEILIQSLHDQYGRIDAVVNNAYPRNPRYGRKLEDVEYIDFCQNVDVHLGGYFLVSQRFAVYFKARRRGNIVNMGSIYGSIAPRFGVYADTRMTMPVEYAAIKSGVIQLTRYFAQYFKADGIRCNSLSPGGILDGQPKEFLERYGLHCGSKGMLDGGDIAGALIFLLSDASRYVTGQNLVVDDGFAL
jgi:NAD(P)-dependent dehydrogenase (short-subunit alcohol dehydrogenase family)